MIKPDKELMGIIVEELAILKEGLRRQRETTLLLKENMERARVTLNSMKVPRLKQC